MRRNIYISPFWEEDYGKLAELLGEDHVLFGSDYPHPEGLEQPGRLRERPRAPRRRLVAQVHGRQPRQADERREHPGRPSPRHRLTPVRLLAAGRRRVRSRANELVRLGVERAVDDWPRRSSVSNDSYSRAEREVDRRQHGTLHVHVQDPLRRLDRVLRQLGDPPGAGQRRVEHLVGLAHVVDEPDLRAPARP